ncbi:DinB family protein [Mongoliibacter ruber]|uniref:Putative damage-inducible protein DinB n=1 Tax=Mongoliibacter ruber TaxID=1750599 RepID=A0A2T0WT43_9BACT|nr:DinB family protein [Mongoliibacter ruber]PRY89744.1 putative damage-inducible protein DinB [Mongoliibacter ruber]
MIIKQKLFSVCLAMGIFLFTFSTSQAQTTMEEFLSKWENGMQFTMEVVDKMPEDKMDYKPHESAMSFKEQVMHLSSAAVGMSQRFLDGPDAKSILEAKPESREELKAHVKLSFEYALKVFQSIPENELGNSVEIFGGNMATKRQVAALIDDHTTHHRGAAISYIRANGIEPPAFRAM